MKTALAFFLLFAATAAFAAGPAEHLPSLANWEQLLLQNLTGPSGVPLAIGSPPAASGACAVSTQTGGQAAGSFTSTGACAGTAITLTFSSAAPNGFACAAQDQTTPADTVKQTSSTTTSVTFAATTAANDIVVFQCTGF